MKVEITFNLYSLLNFIVGVLTSVGLFIGIYKMIKSIKNG